MNPQEVRSHNRRAWDIAVQRASRWTKPVNRAVITAARRGEWQISLTIERPLPRMWFPALAGCDLLCLAGGGGQQAPILAAAGANVTVFDNSPQQLARDRQVAQREGLTLHTVEGDMQDLSVFAQASFDLIVHPCSNLFVADVHAVWRECYRVLRPGGVLLAGFCNPARFIFDQFLADEGILQVRHALPYADLTSLTPAELQQLLDDGQPIEYGHTLEDQIGGQLAAGFVVTGFLEDRWAGMALDAFMPTFIATRAMKSGDHSGGNR
jgi:SAM-dependent methyltransferase